MPADLPLATALGNDPPTITVKANDGSSVRFRALATLDGSGILVVAVSLTEVSRTLGRLLVVQLILSAGVLLGLAALSWWVVRRGLRPLEQMAATAASIAEGDLSRRVQVGNPRAEVGRLGLALNAMLTQIEQAFAQRLTSEDRLRRFLADASHELRTPLTAIRGYAELFRRGAHQRPQDLAKSMRRIEEEAARMGVLVEDMLLLARLDQARPLEREPVDLAAIATDAAQDARAADPSRVITVLASSPVVVVGDQNRLRQVASNLLNNALTHTPPGTPVEVSVQVEEGRAVLAVADWGPGLSADETEHAFEPFYRADKARSRDHGGSGLGLSIVAAIAAAHDGSVDVTSGKDGGALFRVFLPPRSIRPALPGKATRRNPRKRPATGPCLILPLVVGAMAQILSQLPAEPQGTASGAIDTWDYPKHAGMAETTIRRCSG